jgi:hypothetical protein
MLTVLGFIVAVALGAVVALVIAARGVVKEEPTPWQISDVARMHASIMGNLAGISITGIVLMVGLLGRNAIEPTSDELNTVVVMFAVAFSFFLHTAFMLAYLPDKTVVGETTYRFYFALASTLEYRTIFLLVAALTSFAQLHNLTLTVYVLVYLVPISIVGIFTVIAVVADSLGLMSFKESWFVAATGVFLGGIFFAAIDYLEVRDPYSVLTVSLIFAGVNGLSYMLAWLTPLVPRYPPVQVFMHRNARRLEIIDMQTTVISLVYLWLAVVGAI